MTELDKVLSSLNLEQHSGNRFIGHNPAIAWRRTYGGLLLAHAVRAAQLSTEPTKKFHSLHAYFLRPGNMREPFDISVEPMFDGQTISNRQIVTRQQGSVVFSASASLRSPGSGLEYEPPMPDVSGPDESMCEREFLDKHSSRLPQSARRYLARTKAFELRFVDPTHFAKPEAHRTPTNRIWFRLAQERQLEPSMASALLVYASDMTVLDASLTPHGLNFFAQNLIMASLDHSFWLHNEPDLSRWLLFDHQAAGNSASMGLGSTNVFSSDGLQIATVMQQGLIKTD